MNIYTIMNQPINNKMIQDGIYVIAGAQEVLGRPVDMVNVSSRPEYCKSDKISFLISKIGKKYKNKCVDHNANDVKPCTFNNILRFFGDHSQNPTFDEFWSVYTTFVENLINKIHQTDGNVEQINFALATHHNRLKKTIFDGILRKVNKKYLIHFANTCCVKITIENGRCVLKCIFGGFPDKEKNIDLYLKPTFSGNITNGTHGFQKVQNLTSKLEKMDTKGIKINIFIIRHGNAFHNLPLQLGNPLKDTFSYLTHGRPLDSCLTPLGMLQAKILGEFLSNNKHILVNPTTVNIFCSSYMNRAQHTICQVALPMYNTEYTENQKRDQKNLIYFKSFLDLYAVSRLYARLNYSKTKWQEQMKKLENSYAARPLKYRFSPFEQKISKNLDSKSQSCVRFLAVKKIDIPSSGSVEIGRAGVKANVLYDVYTNKQLFGGKRRKYTRKKKHRKKRTKKKALKRRAKKTRKK